MTTGVRCVAFASFHVNITDVAFIHFHCESLNKDDNRILLPEQCLRKMMGIKSKLETVTIKISLVKKAGKLASWQATSF